MNKAIIVGNIGNIEELGDGVGLKISVVTDDGYMRDDGYVKKDNWHSVVIFGKRADSIRKVIADAKTVVAEGSIDYRKHEGRKYTSIKAFRIDIVAWKKPGKNDDGRSYSEKKQTEKRIVDGEGDDLPF